MAVTIEELLQRNQATLANHTPLPTIDDLYAAGNLPKTMIVTCLDPRCIPEKFFNLQTSQVLVCRNAGGNIRHALRDIVVLDYIVGGLDEIAIIHHTDCGAMRITEEETLNAVKAGLDESLWEKADKLAPFGAWTDVAQSVRNDLAWLRSQPLVRKDLADSAQGFAFDIKTGRVERVPE